VALEPKKKYFKGNCGYCKKFGHKLADCYILKKKNVDKEYILLYALTCFESNVVDLVIFEMVEMPRRGFELAS